MKKELTKKQWLKRCELVYDMGLHKYSNLLRSATDVFLRARHVYATHPEYFEMVKKDHQGDIVVYEVELTLDKSKTLANDPAYQCEVMASILDHPCQLCGEDKHAWHTRYGFCSHRKL